MKNMGSKIIETDRLILKPQTMNEQKYLWSVLMIPSVNKYYLSVPVKFREKLKDWNKQEQFYIEEMKHSNDLDIYRWSIFLKNGECIGRISCQEAEFDSDSEFDPAIRDVGWYIDPRYQGNGYCTEAAQAMLKYMFEEVGITEIKTGAAIENPASWKIMERLGFKRLSYTKMIQYTYLDELTEDYQYNITKEMYFDKIDND